MAPEQLNGERGDARADVFAFGVMLYELACGVHPFAGESAAGVTSRILKSDATPIEDLCPALPDIGLLGHRALLAEVARRTVRVRCRDLGER